MTLQTFPENETTFMLQGAAGSIEVVATPADSQNQKNITAIICHPHPLHGGTMNNKVVSTLVRAFKELGLRTVKFNFRGVGKSEGVFDNGIGEAEDLIAVIDWVRQVRPEDTLWLAGFSFGGFIAGKVSTQIPGIAQLVTIAPQVSRFIEAKTPAITVPWVLVQGDKDEVISPEETFALVETIDPKPQIIRMEGAGHFFHGRLVELRERLVEVLR